MDLRGRSIPDFILGKPLILLESGASDPVTGFAGIFITPQKGACAIFTIISRAGLMKLALNARKKFNAAPNPEGGATDAL